MAGIVCVVERLKIRLATLKTSVTGVGRGVSGEDCLHHITFKTEYKHAC